MATSVQTLFQLYPKKVDAIIEETRKHGDPYYAAVCVGISNRSWITALLPSAPSDPKIEQARLSLKEAIAMGLPQQKDYAKNLFLNTLKKHASVAEAVEVQPWFTRAEFEAMKDEDPEFHNAWLDAEEYAVDTLRREAWRRGAEGVDEPQTYKGQIQYTEDPTTGEQKMVTIKRYSDPLLLTLLKRYDSNFNDRVRIDQTNINGTIELTPHVLSQMSDEELHTIKKFVDLQESEELPLLEAEAESTPTPEDEHNNDP